MNVTAAALRELHRIHCQLAELHDRLERGPKQVRARVVHVAKLEANLEQKQANQKQTRMLADQKQLELKSGEQKIVDLKTKLNACSSNREYQALLEQIAAAEMANSVLADEILEALERIDQLDLVVAEAGKTLAEGTKDLEKTKQAVEDTAQSIQSDITRLEGDLETAEAALPRDFRIDYHRVIRGKGSDGLAELDEDTCTGCGQRITLNMQNELKLSRPVFCKGCGRLLYLPESS